MESHLTSQSSRFLFVCFYFSFFPTRKYCLYFIIIVKNNVCKTVLFCCSVAVVFHCVPMDCSTPGFPVLHHLPELKLMSTELMMPSNRHVKGLGPGAQEDPLSPANRKAKARQSLSSETLLWSFSGSLGGEGQGAEPSSGRAQGRLCPLRPALKGSGGPLSLSLGQPRPGPHTLQLSGS